MIDSEGVCPVALPLLSLIVISPITTPVAAMVWLNYRNAYEYWHEARLALNTEIQEATQSVIQQAQRVRSGTTDVTSGSTLFLQLTVNDIGVCVPLTPSYTVSLSSPRYLSGSATFF